MFLRRIVGLLSILCVSELHADFHKELNDQNYEIYFADIESAEFGLDGYPDIYLRGKDYFIPIGVGTSFILPRKSTLGEKMFCGQASGEFVPCSPVGFPDFEETGLFEPHLVDFDGDDVDDLFLHSSDENINSVVLVTNNDELVLAGQASSVDGYQLSGKDVAISNDQGNKGAEVKLDDFYYAELSGGKFVSSSRFLDSNLSGYSKGNLSVNQGVANYAIPITVPDYFIGERPDIKIQYSSNGGYGVLGRKVTLSGLSYIGPCGESALKDGFGSFNDSPQDNDFRYCFNGKRLVRDEPGSYFANGDTLYLENSPSVKFVYAGVGFEVYYPNGAIHYYGYSDSARFSGGGGKEFWALSKAIDQDGFGYEIVYKYKNPYRPYRIISISPLYGDDINIKFNYEEDGIGFREVIYGESYGSKTRLSNVVVEVGGATHKKWKFQYLSDELTGESFLDQIQVCGAQEKCLKPKGFVWSDRTERKFDRSYTTRITDADSPWRWFVDVNRDGKKDYCRISVGGTNKSNQKVDCYFSTGDGGFSRTPLGGLEMPSITLPITFKSSSNGLPNGDNDWNMDPVWVDINKDGFADFCYSKKNINEDKNEAHCHVSVKGADFSEVRKFNLGPIESDVKKIQWVDFNNDSIIDHCMVYKSIFRIAGLEQPSYNLKCVEFRHEEGSDFWSPVLIGTNQNPYYYRAGSGTQTGSVGAHVLEDIDGNGWLDYCFQTFYAGNNPYVYCRWGRNRTASKLNDNGAIVGWETNDFSKNLWSEDLGFVRRKFIDVDNDGVKEYCTIYSGAHRPTISVDDGFGTGFNCFNLHKNAGGANDIGFVAVPAYGTDYPISDFIDIDNDGKLDWCALGADGLSCRKGYYFSSTINKTLKFDLNINASFGAQKDMVWEDINGDGEKNLCIIGEGSVQCFAPAYSKTWVSSDSGQYSSSGTSGEEFSKYITSIEDDLGVEFEIEQKDIGVGDSYTYDWNADAESRDLHYLMSGKTIVTKVLARNGNGDLKETSYNYKNYGYYPDERGGLGFDYISEISQDGVKKIERWYSNGLIPHTEGLLKKEVVSYEMGGAFSKVIEKQNKWKVNFYSGSNFSETVEAESVFNKDGGEQLRYVVLKDASSEKEWSLDGRLIRASESNYKEHDALGNVLESSVVTSNSDESFSIETTAAFENDFESWLVSRKTSAEVIFSGSYQGQAIPPIVNEYSWTYYPDGVDAGKLESVVVEPNSGELKKTTTIKYGLYGLPNEVIENDAIATTPRKTTFSYSYGENFTIKEKNSLDHEYYYHFDPVMGKVVKEEDENGLPISFKHDEVGRVVATIASDNVVEKRFYGDCELGCPTGAVRYIEEWTEGSDGTIVGPRAKFFYNVRDLIVKEESEDFSGGKISVRYKYDDQDRLIAKSEPFKTGGLIYWNEVLKLDVLGRPRELRYATGLLESKSYEGLKEKTSISWDDEVNGFQFRNSEKHVDINGNLRRVVDAKSRVISYTYDALGNLRQAKLPGQTSVIYKHDVLGRKVEVSDANIGRSRYAYNRFDEVVLEENGNGARVCYAYDALGRLVQRVDDFLPDETWSEAKISARQNCQGQAADTVWSFDDPGKGSGRLAYVSHQNSLNEEYFYDDFGRFSELRASVFGITLVEKTKYDLASGKIKKQIMPHRPGSVSEAVEYRYSDNGFLDEIGLPDSEEYSWKLNSINQYGLPTSETYANGLIDSFTSAYDDGRGIEFIKVKNSFSSSWNILNQTYSYNAKSLMIERGQELDAENQNIKESFSYDAVDRLTSVNVANLLDSVSSYEAEIQYDNSGNIKSRSDVGVYSYEGVCNVDGVDVEAGPHAVTSIIGSQSGEYCYDRAGNQIKNNAFNAEYTVFNKPNKIVSDDVNNSFKYGPDRELLLSTVSNADKTVATLTYGAYERVTIIEGGQTTFRERFTLPSGEVVTYTNGDADSREEEFLFTDALGSVSAVTNALGGVVQRYQYDAWGRPRSVSDWKSMDLLAWEGLKRENTATHQGFTSHKMLDEISLIHMGGRVYDPKIGRFMSADPVVESLARAESFNRYAYVLNSPLNFTDPSGYSANVLAPIQVTVGEPVALPPNTISYSDFNYDIPFQPANVASLESWVVNHLTANTLYYPSNPITQTSAAFDDVKSGVSEVGIYSGYEGSATNNDVEIDRLLKDWSDRGYFDDQQSGFDYAMRGLAFAGGGAQVLAGKALCGGTFGIGCGLGILIGLKGVDNMQAAVRGEQSFSESSLIGMTGNEDLGVMLNGFADLGSAGVGLARPVRKITPLGNKAWKGMTYNPRIYEAYIKQAKISGLSVEAILSGGTIYQTYPSARRYLSEISD